MKTIENVKFIKAAANVFIFTVLGMMFFTCLWITDMWITQILLFPIKSLAEIGISNFYIATVFGLIPFIITFLANKLYSSLFVIAGYGIGIFMPFYDPASAVTSTIQLGMLLTFLILIRSWICYKLKLEKEKETE